ncbi:MAG: hypothetical protein H7831_14745 [Magnetococcus sp. WYHC-3]
MEYVDKATGLRIAKAEIHSLVVEAQHTANVAGVPASLPDVEGREFAIDGKCDSDLYLDTALYARKSAGGARGRISLDGYPQNEYWSGDQDQYDFAQVASVAHDRSQYTYIQGYESASTSAGDKLTLCVDGQAFHEQCDAETCSAVEEKFEGEPVMWDWERADEENFIVLKVDLDVDSDNDEGFGAPDRDPVLEDAIEADSTKPGKFVGVNDDDSDGDGIPDYADGYNWDGASGTVAEQKDDASTQDDFIQLIVELPEPIDLSVANLKITYSDSDPASVTHSGTPAVWAPGSGKLRIWKKDGNQIRNKNSAKATSNPGDYVPAGEYADVSKLGLSGSTRTVTLYVEGVDKSAVIGDQEIKIETDPDGAGSAGYVCSDTIRSTVLKVDLDGLRVYDPKLENAGSAEIKYKIDGPASDFSPRIELTVMDAAAEVACIVRRTDASPVIGTEIAKNWDGKWGIKKDGTDTAHKGKFADPKQYKMELKVYESAAATTAFCTKEYDLYIVRLGVTEIKFEGQAANECYPLQYHNAKDADDADGKASAADCYAVPQTAGTLQDLVWRLGDEASNSANVDITAGADKGKSRSEVTPYAETFYPPQDTGTAGGVEDDSFNYPICYKLGTRIKMSVRTSNGGYSQVSDRILAANELGYSAGMDYKVNAYVKWGAKDLDVVTANANKAIDPNEEIAFQSKVADKLGPDVGTETLNITYTWKYEKNGVEKDIPGKFNSSHRAYRIVGPPQSPWNVKRPWIAVLDYAVTWATAANDADSVASKITEKINSGLGLKYDSPGGGGTEGGAHNYGDYANGTALRLANFLLFLNGGTIENRLRTWLPPPDNRAESPADIVNCTDCGTLTVAFSSVLGAPLVLTQLNSPHSCNAIKAIGREAGGWSKPFPVGTEGGFGYHAFAGMNDKIWDACLKVGVGDPTVGGVRTGEKIPRGMVRTLADPASATAPTPVGPIAANGKIIITKVYNEANHRGVVPASGVSFTCTAVAGGQATFLVDCGRNGSGNINVPNVVNGQNSGTISKNGVKIIDFTITQGTVLFMAGHKLVCALNYNSDEYRSSLAAPDWDKNRGNLGRTPATTFTSYPLMQVE